jgi:hypothetical protein
MIPTKKGFLYLIAILLVSLCAQRLPAVGRPSA